MRKTTFKKKQNGIPAYAGMTLFLVNPALKISVIPAKAGIPFFFGWG